MPVGIPDEPPGLPPDPGSSFGGDGSGFGSGASPSGFGGMGLSQSAIGADPRRRQIFRGLRGLGENIPIVTRERGIGGGFTPTPGVPNNGGVPGWGGGFIGDLDTIRQIRDRVGPPTPRPGWNPGGGPPQPPPPPRPQGPPPPPGGDTGGWDGGGIIHVPMPPGTVPPPGTTIQNPPHGGGGGYGGGYETGERGRGQGGRIVGTPNRGPGPPRPGSGPPSPPLPGGPPPPGGNPAGIDPFGGGITDPGTGEPIRRVRPPRTAGGGSGGYNGFPGGNFGMLGAFQQGSDPTGENLYGGAQRRYRSVNGFAVGGMVPGVTPGPPQPSDTVPALLTPGEIVMNRGVTSDPHNASALLAMNQRGVERMAAGGVADGVQDGEMDDIVGHMDSGGGRGFDPRIIRLLGELLCALGGGDDEEGYGCGGMVRGGYAFGGMAGFRPMGGRPVAPRPNAAPMNAAQNGGFNYTRDSGGNVNNYNPQNPWGSLANSTNPTAYGTGTRLLGQAGQQGVFDPRGNQLLLNQQLEAAQGTKDALVRRQMSQADLSGLDPAQRAVAKMQALRETGRGVQDISAGVRADAAGRADDFYRNLFNNYAGADINYILNEQQGRQQRITNASASHGQNKHWGRDMLGQLAGAAIGGFTGGFAGGGVPKVGISAPVDPKLQNLPRPN